MNSFLAPSRKARRHSTIRSAAHPASRFRHEINGIVADLLVDTDVFIDHLPGFRRLTASGNEIAYSAITRAELFAGVRANPEAIELLLEPFREIDVDRNIAELAGRLRRRHGTRIADALIGATALHHDLVLTTRNIRDFRALPELRIAEPD